MRILGNGITSQHALLAIGLGLAYLRDLTPVEVQELIVEALSKRMTPTNIRCSEEDDGTQFGIDEVACRPTLAMQDIILKCLTETIRFQSERGVVVLECIQLVTGDAMPSSVSLLPGGGVNTRVSLPLRYDVKDFDINLFAEVPTALRIQTAAFQTDETQSSCVVVLSAKGLFVLKRDQGMVVSDILTTLNHNIGVRCIFLSGILLTCTKDFRTWFLV